MTVNKEVSEMRAYVTSFVGAGKKYNQQLSRGCNRHLGVTIGMFKFTKNLVHLGSLMLAGYAINEGAEPFISLLFAALIISGPEILEWWLVNQDYDDYKDDE